MDFLIIFGVFVIIAIVICWPTRSGRQKFTVYMNNSYFDDFKSSYRKWTVTAASRTEAAFIVWDKYKAKFYPKIQSPKNGKIEFYVGWPDQDQKAAFKNFPIVVATKQTKN